MAVELTVKCPHCNHTWTMFDNTIRQELAEYSGTLMCESCEKEFSAPTPPTADMPIWSDAQTCDECGGQFLYDEHYNGQLNCPYCGAEYRS